MSRMPRREKRALDEVRDCYSQYAWYVNSTRALPSHIDGLKTVQRRILLTAHDLSRKIKSAQVVGHCIANYHPHGDLATYGALVNLVNSPYPLLIGQGCFGSRGVNPTGPAAMRYTGVELSELGHAFLSLRHYAPIEENDLGRREPKYLPTPIPYCLLTGSRGIGVGCVSLIPQCDIDSIIKYLRTFNPADLIRPAPAVEGSIEYTDEELERFNTTGQISVTFKAQVAWEYDESEKRPIIYVRDIPHTILPSRAYSAFASEIEQGLIFVRDDSEEKVVLAIARNNRIRKISDNELFDRTVKAYTKTVTFNNVVSVDGVARSITPQMYLQTAFAAAEKSYGSRIADEITRIEREIKFYSIKRQLAQAMLAGKSDDQIKINLKLNDEEFALFSGRSIRTMRSTSQDHNRLNSNLLALNKKMKNLTKSTQVDILGDYCRALNIGGNHA